ncbi:FkbM family methyltransferase [uncultured Cyclobacterium sp.]|uniref:FkbM family methyltransferase n=1 Tax=uncultured Cyclobacterium sp. TaxID=453820 RepID=UPI0030EF27C9
MIISKIERRNYDIIRSVSKEKMLEFLKKIYPKKTKHDFIRMGANFDGGYLVPDNLSEIGACYSPGVSDISEFEKDCINRGMKVYMADKTVSKPNLKGNKFHFLKKHIGCINSEEFITIDKWVIKTSKKSDTDFLLQMDIEGFEYASIINISEKLLNKFRIIIIEFHSLESIWHPHFFSIIEVAFSKLLVNHSVVHIHPNNSYGSIVKNDIKIPKIIEVTFLRKDSGVLEEYQTKFPHPLDKDNIKGKSMVLSKDLFYSKNERIK